MTWISVCGSGSPSNPSPNPIGVTVVEVLAIEKHVLLVRGLDAINGTPVLDLKPRLSRSSKSRSAADDA